MVITFCSWQHLLVEVFSMLMKKTKDSVNLHNEKGAVSDDVSGVRAIYE